MDDVVIRLHGVGKDYPLEHHPLRRLWQQLRGQAATGPVHRALHDVHLTIRSGESVGIVGRNGAGKSTLLQVVCGVLAPSSGQREVHGRVAALLELGAGFTPDLTGRENVRLNGPLFGLTPAEVERRLPEIVAFADIGEFIDQPVRSYSSGMFVRLAFALATSVEPDILVVDEALSVGDGTFARKSFDRIMALRESGATLLFCSHSLFQVESLCTRAVWIHEGHVREDGRAAEVVASYQAWLDREAAGQAEAVVEPRWHAGTSGAIQSVHLGGTWDGTPLRSGHDDLAVSVSYRCDAAMPAPTLGVVIHGADGRSVASAGSWIDGHALPRDEHGQGQTTVCFERLPLLKGRYTVSVYLLCERGIHVYALAEHVAAFDVVQEHLEQGIVSLPHRWQPEAVR